jgi:hypothetical protein
MSAICTPVLSPAIPSTSHEACCKSITHNGSAEKEGMCERMKATKTPAETQRANKTTEGITDKLLGSKVS